MKNLSARNDNFDIPRMDDLKAENQTITYTTATALAKLVVGEKLGIAFGKIAKAVDELITHLSDNVRHITAVERTAWNGKAAEDHTHSNMTAATASAAGKAGFVPAPAAGAQGKYLRGDGTWQTPPDTNTTYSNMTAASASAAGKAGLVPAPAAGAQGKYLRGDGTWQTPPDTNTTYSNMTAASASAAGKAGLVPAPAAGAQEKYLRGDGTWQTPPDTNTTYSNMTAASASAAGKAGLVPAPAAGAQGKYLRGDGTWQTPPDTNTNNAVTQTDTTTSAAYRVLLSNNANDTTETAGTRKSTKLTFNPSTGALYAYGQDRIDITDATADIDTYNLDVNNGHPQIMRFICRYTSGAANITNIPVKNSFILDVELIRRASSSDYTTMQTFRTNSQPTFEYVRYCTNGTWGAWTTRKFTDTTYSEATQLKAGLMPAADKKKLDSGYVVKSDDGGLYVEY